MKTSRSLNWNLGLLRSVSIRPIRVSFLLRHHFRLSHGLENFLDDSIARDPFGLAFKVEYQPMPQDGGGHFTNVLLGNVIAMIEDRPDFGAEDHRLCAAGARAEIR